MSFEHSKASEQGLKSIDVATLVLVFHEWLSSFTTGELNAERLT